MSTFGENIKTARVAADFTQQEMADHFDVTRGAVAQWEAGIVYPETARLPGLAEFLRCSVDSLFAIAAPSSDIRSEIASLTAGIIKSANRSDEQYLELNREIEMVGEKLASFRARVNENRSIKYALESLPALIGDQDFKDICLAIGIADDEDVTGQYFVRFVRDHVLTARRELEHDREKLRQLGLA